MSISELNQVSRPTVWQTFVASPWLPRLWQLGGVGWAITHVLLEFLPTWSALANPWFLVFGLIAIVVAGALGWVASFLAAWILLGPIVRLQGVCNGGPFLPGDWVQVIAGHHRGTISRVYDRWQHECVRVDLGKHAEAEFRDVFAAYQLLRVGPPPPHSAGPDDVTGVCQ